MVKLIAIYKKPTNCEAFDKYYFETHLPLANKMPGLIRTDVDKIYGSPMGETSYYLIANMYFENKEALMQALSSPEGKACGKDLRNFTDNNVELIFSELQPSVAKVMSQKLI